MRHPPARFGKNCVGGCLCLAGSLAAEVSDDLEDVDDDVLGYAGLHWLAIDYLRKTDALLVWL